MQNTPNGTTRRSALAGLLSLPAVALTAAGARATVTGAPSNAAATQTTAWMPDVLRQADLQSVFDDLKAIDLKLLGYRRRILGGAVVEPGALTAEFDIAGSGLLAPEDDHLWGEFSAYDLRVCAAGHPLAGAHAS